MQITVEFVGVSRVLTKSSNVVINLGNHGTYQDVLKELGRQFPELVDQMIDQKTGTFIGSNMFSKDGKKMIRPKEMEESPIDGEHLILMSILAGG